MVNEPEYPQYDITFKKLKNVQLLDRNGNPMSSIPGVDGTHLFMLKVANTTLKVQLTHRSQRDPLPMLNIEFTDEA
jgi:hypothetical protein